MRDFERLEELSGTVAAGLEAGEVVLAIDRLLTGEAVDAREREALASGRQLLDVLADPDAAFETPNRGIRGLVSGGAARDAVEAVRTTITDEDLNGFLKAIATALGRALTSRPDDHDRQALSAAMKIFALLGDLELARANTIVRTRKEPGPWHSSRTTSIF